MKFVGGKSCFWRRSRSVDAQLQETAAREAHRGQLQAERRREVRRGRRREIGRNHDAWPRGKAPGAIRFWRDLAFTSDILEQPVALRVRSLDHDARSVAAGEPAAAGAIIVGDDEKRLV